jgi:hypothetical protein
LPRHRLSPRRAGAPGAAPPHGISKPQEDIQMGSNAKKKTTMAKLTRESAVREKRMEKQAKKEARKQAAALERAASNGTAAGDPT